MPATGSYSRNASLLNEFPHNIKSPLSILADSVRSLKHELTKASLNTETAIGIARDRSSYDEGDSVGHS